MTTGRRLGGVLAAALLATGATLWLSATPPAGHAASSGAGDAATDAERRRDRIEALERAIEAHREALDEARQAQELTADELDALRGELEAVREEIEALRDEAPAGSGAPAPGD